MRTLKLFSALVITGFLTMSMGFPTDLAEEIATAPVSENSCNTAKIASAKAVSDKKPKTVKATVVANFDNVAEDEPVQLLAPVSNVSKITLKVFDVKGRLVLKQDVSMDEFLGKSKNAALPAGSTFVMFHSNTAYYFLEAGLAQ